MKDADEPTLSPETAAVWSAWLRVHHGRKQAVWLRLSKRKRTGAASAKTKANALTYAEALEVALAWGWIDSHKKALDADAWLQRFSPRTAQSPWSKINRTKAEALIARGEMQPAGMAEIERAKADGRWDRAYDSARTSTVPADLAQALAAQPRASAFFEKLDAANRYAILYRVQTAKKPETRAERIARFVDMCARHEVIHPARSGTAARHRPAG